jgi:D-cysteine desulfhydrase
MIGSSAAKMLERFPRIALLEAPTPIQRLHRLEEHVGAPQGVALYVKRDDLTGIGGGGNKLRKLEFLLADARAAGADTIITVGARQSNSARLTAAAAARLGMRCELVLVRTVPRDDVDYVNSGNVLLDDLFGALIHDLPAGSDPAIYAKARVAELKAQGRNPYYTPTGGSSPIGCLGYAACALEIEDQSRALGVRFTHIVVANGSSGTHAGLVLGCAAMGGDTTRIKSFSVLQDLDATRETTLEKAKSAAELLDLRKTLTQDDVNVNGDHRGEGYGIPTPGMLAAVRLMAEREGLLLDPVYSGKAFAGLIAEIRSGAIAAGSSVLFIMTGGTPGLYAYRPAFTH